MRPTDPSRPSAARSSWGARAIAAGVASSALAAGLATVTYLGIPGTAALPWERIGPAIVLLALVSGVCLGGLVGGGTLRAVLRGRGRASTLRLTLAAATGGAIAGLLPGLLGIAGLGALPAPYLGSLNVLACVLAGATAFVVLWAPRLLPAELATRIAPARRFSLATLAAVITVGGAGLLASVLAMSLHLVPSLDWLRCAVLLLGLPTLALVGGALLGALAGALIGLCCGVFVALAAATARR